jgi:hypothetical protein
MGAPSPPDRKPGNIMIIDSWRRQNEARMPMPE